MNKNKNELEEMNPNEKFMDLARICVKKQNKGLFDQLITAVYRLKQLTNYVPELDTEKNNKQQVILLITKGLKFKNYKDFKEELSSFESFEFLKELNSSKDYYEYLLKKSEETNTSIPVSFIKDFQVVIKEHYHALNFLKGFVNKEIEKIETELAHMQNMGSTDSSQGVSSI